MTFAFFPAVDLRGGKCVQLVGGVPGTEVVALENPLAQAERWAGQGADHLHIIDLDGAILGKRINGPILSQIVKSLEQAQILAQERDRLKREIRDLEQRYQARGVKR